MSQTMSGAERRAWVEREALDREIVTLFHETHGAGIGDAAIAAWQRLVAAIRTRLPARFKADSRATCGMLIEQMRSIAPVGSA
ncbi:MAG: hypothetical protein AB1749_16775 [Pseudomonadota bacterium]